MREPGPGDSVRPICWVDGRIAPIGEPVVRADDSAFSEGRGCYTSGRVEAGRVLFAERHVERLRRSAEALGIGALDPTLIRTALEELAKAAFPSGRGALRLQASRDPDGGVHLVGVPRALGDEPSEWSAISSPLAHTNAVLEGGFKVTSRLVLALAAEASRDAGADEALLFDRADFLVEGARSNLFVVTRDSALVTPPHTRGAVAGIARTLCLERVAEARERDVARADLSGARELIAVNAVRGACPITQLDGRAVGDGTPGPWAARLATALADDAAS